MSGTVLDIVGCGVLSAAGSGLDALAEALEGRRAPEPDPADAPGGEEFPPLRVRAVTGFRPAERLGGKGLSRLTRTDQMGMVACGQALEQLDGLDDDARRRTGVVLGTGAGSVRRLGEFTRDTFVQERPYMVNPSHFPGTLMNSCAGQTAIRYGLTGVNSTLSGGPTAGLSALRFARNALANHRADRLLAGSVEELSAQSAWAWHRTGALGRDVAVGEGCAVFVLERGSDGSAGSSGTRPLARLLSCEAGYADPGAGAAALGRRLADCVRDALESASVTAEDVAVVAPGAAGRFGWAAVEERALRSALGTPGPRRLPVHRVLGETHSAGASLQLASVLAHWRSADTAERVGLVTSLGPDGQVGCAVVERAGTAAG
ncbi:beta-ketoacyl synthase N-terminal-like domain-containing protein [Actinorugispora endophytica]|uniref:3-oxoacyl-(Acyl-carrier-protein) synthase n=1 Tax=Actinorugispora endophytica TaxID=1605990 RepID=A0A4R6UMX8_9ACTN|nr:beta-ketoacyl synthase N-terminal-like domain-containing protein [Actinorugispora endophytica]TDQ48468.1 3-oxoacyl-(acyl-carrier-protein) synthase [Actinorugispora endophytica]